MRKILIILFLLSNLKIFSQSIINAGNDTNICGGPYVLNATLSPIVTVANPTQISLSDDQFSGVINIGFPFTYYGTTYTTCLISSNNYISFNTQHANGYSPWSIGGNVPTTTPAEILNSVLGPWQDINPGVGGTIRYATVGNAPNRIFVVEYCNIPMFSCTNLQFSSQILLFEGSNYIETHIINKPLCTSWNSGQAIHATHNNGGTIAHVVPGRNSGTQWTAASEGRRWVPISATNYNIQTIPYNPIILGNPGNIQWSIVGNPTVIGTGASITVSPTVTTSYVASISGGCSGIAFRDTVQITVGSAQVSAGADVTICQGNSTQLNATFNNDFIYNWTPNIALNNSTIHNPVANPTATTSYVVQVTSISNPSCVSYDTVVVNVVVPPNISVTDTAICIGNSAILQAFVTEPNGNFLWQPIGANTSTVTVNPTQISNYIVSYTLSVCPTVYDTATVTVYNLPTISVTAQQNPICSGTSTVLTANGGVSYVWQLSPNISDTIGAGVIVNPATDERFYVRGTDANGCSDTSSIFINVYPELSIIGSNDTAICFGDTTQLLFVSASGGNGGPYTYTWLPSNSLTFLNDTLVKAHPPVTTSYVITVTDNCTVTPASDTITVTINPLPLVNIDTDTTQGCLPLKINFKNLTTPAPASCFWNFGNGNYSTTCGDQVNTYKEEGIFSVSLLVTDVNGCKNKLENYPISVFPLPKADFLYTPQPVNVLDQYTQFVDTSSADVITWWWDFGGLGYDSIQHPYFKFEEAGEFAVKQVVMNGYGCYDSITRIIEVNDNLSLWIPNSFTPGNKDGLNDYFMPMGLSMYNGNFELRIFNRWGEEIFKTNTIENPWKGDNCQSGVYTWRLDITDPQGKSIVKYGHVNLIR
ncbi:MAG: PKD domain-containing protein [Bacteroidia bacterium]